MTRAIRLCLPLVLLAACGPRPGASAPPRTPPRGAGPDEPAPRAIQLEPLRIDVDPAGTASHVYDALGLLEEGNDALLARRFDEAAAAYDRLAAEFPESRLLPAALYNAGLALEAKGDWAGAADRYGRVIARAEAGSRDWLDAHFHLGAVLAEAEKFGEAVPVFERLLDRDDLKAAERIEALARLGYALIETKDYVGAEEVLRSALKYAGEIESQERLDNRYYVAMCQFYLGDIPRRQFRAIPLRLPAAQLDRDIEQKSELFLLARDRYVKTVDYKDPFWATAAIHHIGVMYKEFWDQFMAVPVPADLDPAAAKEYVRLVNEEPQLRRLLEKSLRYHERNVQMARDARISTAWSEESARAADEVRGIMARQQKGDLVTPGQAAGKVEALEPGVDGAREAASGEYVPPRLDL